MAVTTEDLLISLQVDSKNASKALEDIKGQLKDLNAVSKSNQNENKKTSESVSGLGFAFVKLDSAIALATKAFNAFAAPIGRALDEANKASTAFDKFSTSMQFFGGNELAAAANNLNKLSDSMEAISGVDGDALLDLAGRGAALGLTNDELEKLMTGATDLAALMGGDVSQAGEALLNSINGQTKAIGKYVPEVLNLKNGQLEAGAAIELTANKLAGLGKAFGETAQGVQNRFDAVIGKTFEKLGDVINESFGLLNAKKASIKFLEDLIKQIEDAKPIIVGFFETLRDLDWEAIALGIGSISAAMFVLSGRMKAMIAQMATAAIAAAPFILVAAKAALAALAVGAIIAVAEILIRNFEKLGTVAEIAMNKLKIAAMNANMMVSQAMGNTEGAEKLASEIDKVTKSNEELSNSLTVDFGVSGRIFDTVTGMVSKFNSNVEEAKNPIKDTNAALGKLGTEGASKIKQISDAAKTSFDALKEMASLSFSQAQGGGGGTEIAQIALKAEQDKAKAAAEYQKIVDATSNKQMLAEAARLLSITQVNIEQDKQNQIAAKQLTALQEISKQNDALSLQYENAGALQQDIIQNNLDSALASIEMEKQAKIAALGALTPAMQAQFDLQAEYQQKLAEQAAAKAPSKEFEQPQKIGQEIGQSISGVMSSGIMGSVAGMASGVGAAVGAAQAVVDFIPQMLDGIGNLIGSITELPMKILGGVTKIISGIGKFFTDFVKNIGSMVSGILEAIVNLISELPSLIINFITEIPKMILGIVEKLPSMIEKLVSSLVSAIPGMAIALIDFLIKDAPKIAIQMTKVLAIQIPKAIINGIINGIKSIGSAIKNLFSGGGGVVKDIAKSVATGFQAGIKKLSGVGAKIFEVKDLAADAMGPAADKASELLDQITAAGKGAFDWIIKAWNWVKENVLAPMWDTIVKPFQWAWDSLKATFYILVDLFRNAWEGLKIIGTFVASLFVSAWESLKSVFYFVRDIFMAVWEFAVGIFETIGDSFTAVFDFIVKLFDDPVQAFKDLWQDFKDIFGKVIDNFQKFFGNIGDAIGNFGKRMWDNFKEALSNAGSFFSDIGSNIWNGMKKGLSSLGDMFKNLGGNIWDGLKSGISSIGNFFKNLFKFDGGGTGAVENFFGFDFPFFAFAEGGKVPGYASQPGDSQKNDKVAALLSPGEMVMPRTIVNDPAYLAVLEAMFRGEKIPTLFSFEEAISTVGGAISSGADYVGGVASGIGNAGSSILSSVLAGDFGGVMGGLGDLGMAFVPQEIKDMFNSVKRYVQDIDWQSLVTDPTKEIKRMLKAVGTTFLQDPFRQLLDNFMPMAEGGLVTGGVPGRDSVPSMLMPGEFVLNRNAVSNLGLGNLTAMNNGGSSQPGNITFNIEMKIENKDPMDENFLRNKLMPRMQEELKRASMEGKFVISQRGIRTV